VKAQLSSLDCRSAVQGHSLSSMCRNAEHNIFLVDDEPLVRETVGKVLRHLGADVTCFACAADCLEQLGREECDLLITDIKMPGIDGMELLRRVKRLIPSLPVLVITGYGDIRMAVRAMRAGAVDFIEKPLDRKSLLSLVGSVLRRDARSHSSAGGKVLTKTEREVLLYMLQGRSNKEIAVLRSRSIRTIEGHRRHIFEKLGVDNLMELVRKMSSVGDYPLAEQE